MQWNLVWKEGAFDPSEKFAVKLRLKYLANLDTHITIRFPAITITGLFCVPKMSCIISYGCSVHVPLVHTVLLLKQPRVALSLDFFRPPHAPSLWCINPVLFLYQNIKSLLEENMLKMWMVHCLTSHAVFGSLRVTVITAAFKSACCQRISHRPLWKPTLRSELEL